MTVTRANPYRLACFYCDSDNLWFDVLDEDNVVVHCMDCGAEYLQTDEDDYHRLPDSGNPDND